MTAIDESSHPQGPGHTGSHRGQRHQRHRRVGAQGHARGAASGRGAPRTSRCSPCRTARSCSASASGSGRRLIAAFVGIVGVVPAGRPGVDRRQARVGAHSDALTRAVRPAGNTLARPGLLRPAGRLGDRARRAVDTGHGHRLRATRLEPRRRHEGRRVRGRRAGDRRRRDHGLRAIMRLQKYLTIALIIVTAVYVALTVDHIHWTPPRHCPPGPPSRSSGRPSW